MYASCPSATSLAQSLLTPALSKCAALQSFNAFLAQASLSIHNILQFDFNGPDHITVGDHNAAATFLGQSLLNPVVSNCAALQTFNEFLAQTSRSLHNTLRLNKRRPDRITINDHNAMEIIESSSSKMWCIV